jgi:NNP family nitrate/nitrite transporter-like MFS transporter
MLQVLLSGACLFLGLIAFLPPVAVAIGLLAFAMSMLGMGNGSVFQLVPQRFPDRVGTLTGLVGAAGGFGGFLLPSLLGFVKDATGSFGIGFLILSGCFFAGSLALFYLKNVWARNWPADAARRAGLISSFEESAATAYAAGS